MNILNKYIKEETDFQNDIKLLFERSNQEIVTFDVEETFDYDTDVLEHFEMFYELEYKYNMLKNKGFQGVEKRKENIINFIENKAKDINKAIASSFEDVFSDWLENHALLSAEKWATQRVMNSPEIDYYLDTNKPGDLLHGAASEYARYLYDNRHQPNYEKIFSQMIKEAFKNIDDYPSFKDFIIYYFEPDARNMMYDSLDSEGLEDFNNIHNTKFKTEDEAREYIDDYEFDAEYFQDFFYADSIDEFANMISNHPDWNKIIIELYQNQVFPIWFEYWKGMGIEETRENVEKLYEELKSISRKSIKQQFVTINLATNAVHQTGDMMEYYEQEFQISKNDLDNLSNRDVEDWNQELRTIGVII